MAPNSSSGSVPTDPPAVDGSSNPSGDGAIDDSTGEDFLPLPEYPAGPYGRGAGAVIANVEFIGWHDPVAAGYDPEALERVSLSDFYDPSGERTKLLVVNASAVWCAVCQAEMREIKTKGLYHHYRELGVEFLGTLFEDGSGAPAKPSDLELWGSAPARSIEFPLVLDPSLQMGAYFSSDATPLNLLLDAQTMRILQVQMGYDGSDSGLWSLVDAELEHRGVAAR
jgi:hypothetical protein